MERRLAPEILDLLPPGHSDAQHSRRDLRLTNRIMGNWRWFEQSLPTRLRPGESVLEIGAGTGELGRQLQGANLAVDGLDLWPRPSGWPDGRRWHQTRAEEFSEWERYPVVIGNLIFHQFDHETLLRLGTHLERHCRMILACEPLRRRSSQWLFAAAARVFGANHVTRHDARVSIAAGFRGDELPRLLGLTPSHWQWQVQPTALGAYRIIARRTAP